VCLSLLSFTVSFGLYWSDNTPRLSTVDLYPETTSTSKISVATLVRGSEFGDSTPQAMKTLNSLKSFVMLRDIAQVIVLVEDSGSCAHLPDELSLRVRCAMLASGCHHAFFHKPTIGCVLRQLRSMTTTDVLVFVNSDIVLFDGLMAAIHTLENVSKKYVMVGRRLDVKPGFKVDVRNKLTHKKLELHAREVGFLHGDYGLDYFVMKTEDFPIDLPEFLIGTWRWDNTLLALLMAQSFDVVDGTSVVTAIHQGVNSAQKANHTLRIGAEYNDKLAAACMRKAYILGRVNAADFELQMRHSNLALVPKTHDRVYSLYKCMIRRISFGDPLLVFLANSTHLERLSEMQEWIFSMREINYIIISGDVDDADIISKSEAKVCYAPIAAQSNQLGPLIPATAASLLDVAQLGVDLAFSQVFPIDAEQAKEVLSPVRFGQTSLHVYETNMIVNIVAGEVGLEYLRRVARCQKRASVRVRLCMKCFFSAETRRNLLGRRYMQCFNKVWAYDRITA